MNLNQHFKSLWQRMKQDKAKRQAGISALLGVALGLAVLTVPSTIFGYAWQGLLFGILLKFGKIFFLLSVAALAAIGAQWLPRLRSSMWANKLAHSAANRMCALALNAAALLAGLNSVVFFCHEAHAFLVFFNGAIWLLALRQFVIEQASGAPRTNVTAACTGWMVGVSFQPNIAHFMAMAIHHI
ncbi:hypothetical protein [Burkholderia gladioli]|uniref:hypothetical protein n=1 Tax=Burkholderia gladioli TaxID=28095 RepID=UPI001641E22C|nr:hypothetical protein [Burkholderia gladioli]